MADSKFKYGQRSGQLNDMDVRAVLVPHPPVSVDDAFIARMYSKSLKPTTVENMYSRWINTCSNLTANTVRSRHEPIESDCKVLFVSINDDNLPNHYAIAAAIQLLGVHVIPNLKHVKHIEVSREQFLFEDEPQLLILIQSYDPALSDTIFVTNDDLTQLMASFRR